VLIVHHLGRSQSERIVWLCEELGVPFELKRYERDPATVLAPPEYKALHPLGAAPVITDGDLVLAESGAVAEYILAKHGPADWRRGRTTPPSPITSTGSTSQTAPSSRSWGATWFCVGSDRRRTTRRSSPPRGGWTARSAWSRRGWARRSG
jgi:hypothetical protein